MGSKKKKKKQQHTHSSRTAEKQAVAEEILAIQSIFPDEFSLHEDGIGFQLLCLPHPSHHIPNWCSVELNIRYTAEYPASPLELKLRNPKGLSSGDVQHLAQQLTETATASAQLEQVCVFDLVGVCQEFLTQHNDAAGDAHASTAAAAAASEAAAAAAENGQLSEPLSLWHEMQKRQQAEEAALESELSTGPGLQGPGGIFGEDLWMFDGGLFAEEGEPSFVVPSLSSQQPQGPKVRRQAKGSSLRPDVSPEPLYHLASSPNTPGMMDRARGLLAAGRSPQVSTPARKPPAGAGAAAGAAGALKAAAAAGAGAGAGAVGTLSPAIQNQLQHAGAGGAASSLAPQQPVHQHPTQQQQQQEEHIQQPAQRVDESELQQLDAPAGDRSSKLRLLLSHSHSCSFSNLPESLQQLLNSGDGRRKRRKSRPKLTRHAQPQQQPQPRPPDQQQHEAEQGGVQAQQQQPQQRQVVGGPLAVGALQASRRAESLVFGDIDSSVYRRLSNESAAGRAAAQAAATAGDADGSSSESGSSSASDSSSTSSRRVSGAGASDMQRATSEETESSGEEEGPSLRSQLLLGHLLLMASDAVAGGAAAGGVSTASGSTAGTATSSGLGLGLGSVSGSSVSLQPAGLQVLAGHLHRAGLLPKWVYWLLKQMPQRPELYERAFNRLFQQEIQQSSSAGVAAQQQPHPSQVLKMFWDRQAAQAAAAALAAAAASTAAPAAVSGLPGASSALASSLTPPSTVSRYRSDFREENRLGQGGFGVVVAAVNRLDGRKYAVKKIRLQPGGSSSSYSRILREVATLSRLQHPNVVRYYQAWTEQAQEGDSDVDAEPSDGGEWGDLSSSEVESSDEEEESSTTHQGGTSSAAPTSTVFSSCSSSDSDSSSSGSSESGSTDSESSSDSSSCGGSELGLFGDPSMSIPPNLPVPFRRKKPQRSAKDPRSPARVKPIKSSSGAKRRSRPAGPSQILYIQMEFCPRTLSQVLEAGALEEADAWVVLRGILAGLAHIHSQGAIHRDLKPANIFYDSKGDVKLGDFGLAKFQAQQARQAEGGEQLGTGSPRLNAQQRLSSMGGAAVSAAAPSDVTGICGTGYYISPEIANGWASYDEKVDLYSLGVVVFEMWHRFSTAMERAVLLRELREAGKLPAAWESQHPQVARLIRWLMSPKPADRPSARQVLTSDLLPPRLEDEQLKDLLRSLPDNEIAYERVVDSLFSISTSREPQTTGLGPGAAKVSGSSGGAAARAAQALTSVQAHASGVEGLRGAGLLASQQGVLPIGELPGVPLDAHLDREDEVTKVVRDVSVLHGAVQLSSSPLGLSHLGLPKDAVRFLAPSGAVVALRYETRYPLAAWYAQQAALAAGSGSGGGGYYSNGFGSSSSSSSGLGLGGGVFGAARTLDHGLKRFEVCKVQRAGRGGRGLPASYLIADFDVITPAGCVGAAGGAGGRERLLAEAEVVKVVTQVLDALPEMSSYEVRLGHTQILAAAITGMALPPGVSPASVMDYLASAAAVSAAHSSSEHISSGGAAPGHTGGNSGADAAVRSGHTATGGHTAAGLAAASSSGDSSGSSGAAGGVAAARLHTWPGIRAALDGMGLDSTPVSRCRQCAVQLPGPLFSQLASLRSFIRELRPLLGSAGTAAALTAADDLQALGQLLVAWGVHKEQLLLEPLLTPQAEYFSGALFQVHVPVQSHAHHGYSVVQTSAVAAGGRYDALLRNLWSPAAAAVMPAPGAVGVTLNCEKIVKLLHQRQQHRAGVLGAPGSHGAPGVTGLLQEGGGRQPGSQCDVLVCVRGRDGRLQVRMSLLAQLWAAGISAQMLPREAPDLAEQYGYADACGAKWLVIIDDKTTSLTQGLVHVKRWRRTPDDGTASTGRSRRGEGSNVAVADLARFLQLGLSGAQDPSKGLGGVPLGVEGSAVSGGSSVSAGSAAAAAGGMHMHHRGLLLHRSGSGSDLRSSRGVESSLDSYESGLLPEGVLGREAREGYAYREGGGAGEGRRDRDRDRGEQQGGGRHRDRRR